MYICYLLSPDGEKREVKIFSLICKEFLQRETLSHIYPNEVITKVFLPNLKNGF